MRNIKPLKLLINLLLLILNIVALPLTILLIILSASKKQALKLESLIECIKKDQKWSRIK